MVIAVDGLTYLETAMSTTFSSFGVTVAWDIAAFTICLFVFNFLRRFEHTKKVYAPKRYILHEKYIKPKPLSETHGFSWIRALLQYTEEDCIKIAGFDAAVYLRIFSFGIRLFAIASIFNLLVVLPVNITGDRVDTLQKISSGELTQEEIEAIQLEDSTALNDTTNQVRDLEDQESVRFEIGSFDKLSMTNVHPKSHRLWAHLIAMWFMTLFTLKLLWQYHAKAVALRIQFLATTENGAQSHTVLVTDVPGLRFGSPLDSLMRSALFKYLPLKIRERVERSIELLFSAATEGVDKVSVFSTHFAKNVAGQIPQALSRPKLRLLKNKKNLRRENRVDSFHIKDSTHDAAFVTAEDITDMDPLDWVTSQLKIGMPLEKIVENQFKEVYPEDLVQCSNLIYDTSSLEKMMGDYEKTVESLEDLIDHYKQDINKGIIGTERKKKRLVTVVEGKWAVERYGAKPLEVDLMLFLAEKLQSLKMRIQEAQEKITDVPVPSAFVTFKTRWAQVIAATSLHHHFQSFWQVKAAPHPQELVWTNLQLRAWERWIRKCSTWAAFAILCIFFLIPVTFVQGIIQMDRLEHTPIIGSIVTFPLVNGVLKGVLPNLALKLFLAVLPGILKNMSYRQGLISLSEIDFEVVRKYFIFQTVAVFFYSFISSSVFNQIKELRDNPSSIINILGVSAPQSATFFITYILYTGLFEGGISFLNIPNLVKLWLISRFAGTERARARTWSNQTIEYGSEVPSHTFTILLGLAFSVVNPMVLPVALLYFLAMKLTWTYNMLYIYSEEYQSGGQLWEYVFEQVLVGLVVMQLMTMFLMAIKKFPYLFLIAPLPVLTLLFRFFAHKMYDKPLKVLSLRAAHDLDVADEEQDEVDQEEEEGEEDENQRLRERIPGQELEESVISVESKDIDYHVQNKYKHPSFLIDWDQVDALLQEAKNLDHFICCLGEKLTKTGYITMSRHANKGLNHTNDDA